MGSIPSFRRDSAWASYLSEIHSKEIGINFSPTELENICWLSLSNFFRTITLMTPLLEDLQNQPLPDEFGEVRVIEAHQQLCIFPNVADKVLEVHIEAVSVGGVENWLPPEVQTLLQGLQRISHFHGILYFHHEQTQENLV